jgi:hypothetical protein
LARHWTNWTTKRETQGRPQPGWRPAGWKRRGGLAVSGSARVDVHWAVLCPSPRDAADRGELVKRGR